MKKLCSIMFAILLMVGCSASSDGSFKGKNYKLTYAENGADITLGFSPTENKYHGRVVNNYFGMYTIDGNSIKFGPTGSTMMMGPQKLMQAEQNYFQTLPKIKTFKVHGKKLTLTTDNGEKLVFEEIENKE